MTTIYAAADDPYTNHVLRVDTVANLRLLDPPPTGFRQVMMTEGATSAGVGGQTYYWDSASTATDDGSVTVKPSSINTTDPGRWIAMLLGSVVTGGVASIATMAALRALATTGLLQNQKITVLGYSAAGDSGAGEYYWDAASSATDNSSTIATVVQPTSITGNGRWLRIEPVSILENGRTAPHANFNWFTNDWTVVQCQGPGRALLSQDIADVFQNKFSATISGGVSYVHPSGSDASSGGNWRTAFLTVAKALRNTANGTIYLWPGSYDLSDFRYTDTLGGQPKKIIAPYGGVTLRVSGDDVSASTWSLSGDYNQIYNCCLTTTNKPIRLLRKDLLDQFGEYTPMPLAADYASLGAVAGIGWAYESAYSTSVSVTTTNGSNVVTTANYKGAAVGMSITGSGIPGGTTITALVAGVSITMSQNATASASITATVSGQGLWVRAEVGANVNTTTKANIQVIYGDSSGDARTLLYSTTSYWENITFWGYISALNAAGQATPQFWAKNCTFKYGGTHAVLVEGGYSYTQGCRAHRPAADGANYNITNSITSHGVEINFTTQFAGDIDTYGSAQTLNPQGTGTNKNGSSNHDSYVVRVNGNHYEPFGPDIADTATSYSWNMGVSTGHSALSPNVAPSTPRYGILNQGNNAWLDGCSATGNDGGFNSDTSANVRIFNSFGTQVITNAGTFTPYTPS